MLEKLKSELSANMAANMAEIRVLFEGNPWTASARSQVDARALLLRLSLKNPQSTFIDDPTIVSCWISRIVPLEFDPVV